MSHNGPLFKLVRHKGEAYVIEDLIIIGKQRRTVHISQLTPALYYYYDSSKSDPAAVARKEAGELFVASILDHELKLVFDRRTKHKIST